MKNITSYRDPSDSSYLIIETTGEGAAKIGLADGSTGSQLRTLAHLVGGTRSTNGTVTTFRLPYEAVCRLAGRQQHGEPIGVEPATEEPAGDAVKRLCRCGKPLHGRADQKFCTPACRVRAHREDPETGFGTIRKSVTRLISTCNGYANRRRGGQTC